MKWLTFKDLEEQLHEEENKVNSLNKAKAKLERELDEVKMQYKNDNAIDSFQYLFLYRVLCFTFSKLMLLKKRRKFAAK